MATFYEIWAHLCHYYLSTGNIPNAKYEIRGKGSFPLDISTWVNKPISSVDKKILDRINNGSFIDLACGTGRHLKYLENKHSCSGYIEEHKESDGRKYCIMYKTK